MRILLSFFLVFSPLLFLAAGEQNISELEHQPMDMSPLFFIIISLFIGINTKRFLRKIPIPYTVILLIIGVLLGAFNRYEWFGDINLVTNALDWASHIGPEIILYVFLPTLIFEAAFDLDVHTFKKSFANAFILAVPGIAIAISITAAMVLGIQQLGIGFENWDWKIAAMFGAIICATDPVAVVSLLKELGGGKRLRTLIESESLLNDGTAIVIFMVFFTIITGTAIDNNPAIDFLIVTLGGVVIGGVIGLLTLFLLRKVFNDPSFEITGIIGSAYLTFFIAESYHLSGVIGLVTLGLIMAGRGKTRISPEVGHFLHDFWGLAAFLANTLIFIIVGVIIGQRTKFQLESFIDLALVYLGIHVIRGFVILIFYPLMKKIGYGVNRKEATVLWWGGLRGVIGLAMALIVVEYNMTNKELINLANVLGVDLKLNPLFFDMIKEQFLFITAGIVLLTSLINATTIKALVKGLGLTKISYARSEIIQSSVLRLQRSSDARMELLKKDRFMSGANWDAVKKYLPKSWNLNDTELLEKTSNGKIIELRTVLLNKEKSCYWQYFSNGFLGMKAYDQLTSITNELLDEKGNVSLAYPKYIDELWFSTKFIDKILNWSFVQNTSNQKIFTQLNYSYDAVKGFIKAQQDILLLLKEFSEDENNNEEMIDALKKLNNEVNEKKIQGKTYLRNLKNAFPEVYQSIETKYASRDILNQQRNDLKSFVKSGRIDSEDAGKLLDDIEFKMYNELNTPAEFVLPKSSELIKDIPWLKDLSNQAIIELDSLVEVKLFPFNYHFRDELFSKNGLGIIARGIAKLTKDGADKDSEVIAKGELLSHSNDKVSKTDKVVAETPLTVIWVSSANVSKLKAVDNILAEKLISEKPMN
jgi:NhaP-type Na+/H+ or K+/H+ antiporter